MVAVFLKELGRMKTQLLIELSAMHYGPMSHYSHPQERNKSEQRKQQSQGKTRLGLWIHGLQKP